MKVRATFLALACFAAQGALAATTLPSPSFLEGSGVSMKLTNYYEDIPPSGYLPIRVEVKNDSGSPHTWRFHSMHTPPGYGTVSYTAEFTADATSEQVFNILVPLSPQGTGSGRYSNLQISISGHGVANGQTSAHSPGRSGDPTPYFGMGEELAVKNWGPLENQVKKKRSRVLDGTSLDMDMMPSDWRGISGFQIILLTAAEWRGLPADSRGALMDWVSLGGQLLLGYSGASGAADLPKPGRTGVGTIEHWVLTEDLVTRLDTLLENPVTSIPSLAQRDYNWSWSPAKTVGRPEPPQVLILVFVICFAIIIGPVNFFFFAPTGMRHRLFWTTPVISVTASVLMGLFILLSEGVGGSGRRFSAMLSLGDQNKAIIWQEQVSRTGVLLSGAFELSDPRSLIVPIRLSDDSYRPYLDRGLDYSLNNNWWSGDWFRSRKTQAQALLAVTSSRGKLEFSQESGTPSVVSTFEHALSEVWYFDQAGQAWQITNLGPGEKRSLAQARTGDFDEWMSRSLKPAGAITRSQVEGFAKNERPGKFFALAENPERITSLSAIRWKDDGGMIFGQATP